MCIYICAHLFAHVRSNVQPAKVCYWICPQMALSQMIEHDSQMAG